MKKIGCCIFAVLLMMSLFGVTCAAKDSQQLVFDYTTDDGSLENVEFSLYYLGGVSGNTIIPVDKFASYSVSYTINDAQDLSDLALTLSAYAQRDNITPDYTDTTDKNGIADFDGNYFEGGAYLYFADKHIQNDSTYFCQAAIVILPSGESDSVTVKPKYEVEKDADEKEYDYKVLKAWEVENGTVVEPYVEVELLRDGEVYDVVILNDSNNWRYVWENLSAEYQWLVVEKEVTDGYQVLVTKSGKTFLVTNSDDDDDETTTMPESTTTDESTTADESTTTSEENTTPVSTTSPSGGGTDLPQTGALKWPVPYLACFGLAFITAGYAIYRKDEAADEQE